MLHNFLYTVCGCAGDWQMSTFVQDSIAKIKAQIGDRKVMTPAETAQMQKDLEGLAQQREQEVLTDIEKSQ